MKLILFSVIGISGMIAMERTKNVAVVTTVTHSRPLQIRMPILPDLEHHIKEKEILSKENCCALLGRILLNTPAVVVSSPLLAFDAALMYAQEKLKMD